jgi:hypothetical protein
VNPHVGLRGAPTDGVSNSPNRPSRTNLNPASRIVALASHASADTGRTRTRFPDIQLKRDVRRFKSLDLARTGASCRRIPIRPSSAGTSLPRLNRSGHVCSFVGPCSQTVTLRRTAAREHWRLRRANGMVGLDSVSPRIGQVIRAAPPRLRRPRYRQGQRLASLLPTPWWRSRRRGSCAPSG